MQHQGGEPVGSSVNAFPPEAEALVKRIEALLAQAEAILAHGGSDEAAYALRETERRYLPDTLKAYADIPPVRRDAAAGEMLVEQLRLLERATAQRLAVLSENAETQLAANKDFLTERFGPIESLPDAPQQVEVVPTTPAAMVRRVFAQIEGGTNDARPLIERAAAQLSRAFPAVASVKRGGLFGNGPVEAIWVDVPRREDVLRYELSRTRFGGVEASVTRFLRGIKNKSVTVDVGEWSQALSEDLAAYVERERDARDTLTRLFREA